MASFLSWTYHQRVWPPIRNQTLEPQVTNDLVARQAIHSVHVWEGTRRKREGEVGGTPGLNISIWKGDLSLRLEVKVNSLELTSPRQRPNFLSLQTSTLHTIQVTEWSKYLFIYSPPALLLSNRLMRLLSGTYGEDAVTRTTKGDQISVKLDGQIAVIDLETLEVECSDESLQSHVACTVKRLHNTMVPCHSWDKWRWTAPSGWKKACKIKLKNACIRL